MIRRRLSKQVMVGNVPVGGGAPISVQSMTKTDTRDIAATTRQVRELEAAGCEIVRVAVPDAEAAEALGQIVRSARIPVVADIHFDYRLALAALNAGVHGLRLNPGNIRQKEHIKAIVMAARERRVPIRIGVNAGSVPPSFKPKLGMARRMVDLALEQVRLLEDMGFDLIKISLKAFDIETTVRAYRMMARKSSYPLHLGITESGLPQAGTIRSAVGLGILLYQGIGDTIRVSLTGHPVEEVRVGFEILKSLGLRQRGPVLVSCPTCGRTETDLITMARAVEELLSEVTQPIKVAVMGCVVNGPGEARDADVGIACGKGRCAIFRKGKIVATVDEGEALSALFRVIGEAVDSANRQHFWGTSQ
ncbi:MAG: flavodoxin-dependent (E)-4-hydroxy-3-methylbut-2-enyl-diphosphate synthase [Dehalococcoidia bacterium]|nr:flavodoxin-dependent (E)-4-hydroxy-3-methylbut-2-enyl-diphosphate synthase [Dehalococcoidia bacterium]